MWVEGSRPSESEFGCAFWRLVPLFQLRKFAFKDILVRTDMRLPHGFPSLLMVLLSNALSVRWDILVIVSPDQRHQLSSPSLLRAVLHKHSRIQCKWLQVFPPVSSSNVKVGTEESDLLSVCHTYHIHPHMPEHAFLLHSNKQISLFFVLLSSLLGTYQCYLTDSVCRNHRRCSDFLPLSKRKYSSFGMSAWSRSCSAGL